MSKIASFFWGSLSRLEWVCLNSFIKNGFLVDLYTCGPMNVPEGVRLKDAGEFIDCSNIMLYGSGAKSGAGSPSLTSNIFRYRLLRSSRDCYWVDTDMLCLQNFKFEGDYTFGFERGGIINSAILGVGKNGDLFGFYDALAEYVDNPFRLSIYDHPKVFLKKV